MDISVNKNLDLIHPLLKEKALSGISEAKKDGLYIKIFEGFRSSARTDFLYSLGRTKIGKVVTNASSGKSWHNYGLAVDIVFFEDEKWMWAGNFCALSKYMIDQGLEWGGKSDACHFQLRGGLSISQAQNIVKKDGLLELWDVISKTYAITL